MTNTLNLPEAPASFNQQVLYTTVADNYPQQLRRVELAGSISQITRRFGNNEYFVNQSNTILCTRAERDELKTFSETVGTGFFYINRADVGIGYARFSRLPIESAPLDNAGEQWQVRVEWERLSDDDEFLDFTSWQWGGDNYRSSWIRDDSAIYFGFKGDSWADMQARLAALGAGRSESLTMVAGNEPTVDNEGVWSAPAAGDECKFDLFQSSRTNSPWGVVVFEVDYNYDHTNNIVAFDIYNNTGFTASHYGLRQSSNNFPVLRWYRKSSGVTYYKPQSDGEWVTAGVGDKHYGGVKSRLVTGTSEYVTYTRAESTNLATARFDLQYGHRIRNYLFFETSDPYKATDLIARFHQWRLRGNRCTDTNLWGILQRARAGA